MDNHNKIKLGELGYKLIPGIVWRYLSRNKLPLGLLVISSVLGSTKVIGLSPLPPWKNWEACAWGFTLFYTLYIYRQCWKKHYFKASDGQAVALAATCICLLIGIFALSLNEYFSFLKWSLSRPGSMLVLFVTTLLFIMLDFTMAKALTEKEREVSKSFFLSMKFSDIPISIAFGILTVYAFRLGDREINQKHMDSFFGGTIAFQMMLSNIIWTLTGDVFVEHPDPKPVGHLTANS